MATNPTGPAPSLVDRAKNIIVNPKAEWAVIDSEPSTIGDIYKRYVVILAAIPAVAMAVGLLLFGINLIIVTIRPSAGYILSNAIVQYVLALVGCYVLALIIEALAPTFGGVKNRTQAFKLAAYSYTPAWVAGIVLLMPSLAILLLIASIYGVYLLYVGLPILMKSAADKTAIYFAAIVVAWIVLYLVIAAITGAVTRNFTPTAPLTTTYPG